MSYVQNRAICLFTLHASPDTPYPLHRMAGDTFLGIECGATRTVALCADSRLRLLNRFECGPANLRLLTDAELLRHFQLIGSKMPIPASLCIGMAGARSAADRRRICTTAARIWPNIPCYPTNDLETALKAGEEPKSRAAATILVLSGTGSCCFGRTPDGRSAKVGGWGHILGDKGSGFEIALRGLKAVVYYYDCDGQWPKLGAKLLRALQLNHPDELIEWVQTAPKPEVAALAIEVFKAAKQRDKIAGDILKGAAHSLAADAAACARRLTRPTSVVNFILSGGTLTHQETFRKQVQALLRSFWPKSKIRILEGESAWGAVRLAVEIFQKTIRRGIKNGRKNKDLFERGTGIPISSVSTADLRSLHRSPTEQRNPRSMRLDEISISEAVTLMLEEDSRIPSDLLKERAAIEKAVRIIAQALKSGGRLFYVGAGTSGRLGVLDASECPPTFQTDPDLVQGIMAGGQRALWQAVEGAEDDPLYGADAIRFRGVKRGDVVVGIAASGRTPFVWGALAQARTAGATTILLCFNPHVEVPRNERPDVVICPNVGPEILTGSTRLKAGTATKLILNMFTTLAMVQLGKVLENLMIDVKASNSKLRDRAVRIVQQLTGAPEEAVRRALRSSGWQVRTAVKKLKH